MVVLMGMKIILKQRLFRLLRLKLNNLVGRRMLIINKKIKIKIK